MKVMDSLLNGLEVLTTRDADILKAAARILEKRLERKEHVNFDSYLGIRDYLKIKLGAENREVFCVLFLNQQHKLLSFEPLFAGTHNQCHVHLRELIVRALDLKAAAVVLAHNHPNGEVVPSRADKTLTKIAEEVMGHIDVRVLDHIIVGGNDSYSFAENGLL